MRRHILFNPQEFLLSHTQIEVGNGSFHQVQKASKTALLTGATGFIGGFLLKELLDSNQYDRIYCLVRCTDRIHGRNRLFESLKKKDITVDPEERRIEIVCGDVTKERLGIRADLFEGLSDTVDVVFHFAAVMNWVTPFSQETIGNIFALKECVRFCGANKIKALQYASSMGIWTLLNQPEELLMEDAMPAKPSELPGGYFQSKWINEVICQKAMEQGIPVNIFRIGDVKGCSENGIGDPSNLGNIIMKFFIQENVILNCERAGFNYLPVDYLAKAISYISGKEINKTFQFSNPEMITFRHMYEILNKEGFVLKVLDMENWPKLLGQSEGYLGRMLKPVFKPFKPDTESEAVTLYDMGIAMFTNQHDTRNTENALTESGISCPKMLSDDVLRRYLLHLEKSIEKVV